MSVFSHHDLVAGITGKDLVFVKRNFKLDEAFLPEQEHDIFCQLTAPQVKCAACVSKPVHEFLGGLQIKDGLLLISLGAVSDHVNHDSGILGAAVEEFPVPLSAFFHQTITDFKVKSVVDNIHDLSKRSAIEGECKNLKKILNIELHEKQSGCKFKLEYSL